MSLLMESAVKSSVILLVAFGLLRLLRGRSAALRHWVLAVAIASAALAPAAGLALMWQVPVPAEWSELTRRATRLTASDPAQVPGTAVGPNRRGPVYAAAPAARPFSVARWLFAIWIAGALAAGAMLLVGLWRLARLASGSARIDEGLWTERARAMCVEEGFTRPVRLLQGGQPSLLVTWGTLRPRIIVPDLALRWAEDRVSVVLRHELAHIRRGDWLVQLAAEIFRCVHWFNPIVWIACARLRRESEQACDDAVLNHGVEGIAYAKHLVEIACELKGPPVSVPAVAMARSSSLERRVVAMLDPRLNRRPVTRTAGAAAMLAVLTVAVPIAGLAAAQRAFATLTGSVSDPMDTVVPGVTLVLTNPRTDARYEVRSDRTGRYEFLGVVPGEYLFEAQLPGFAALRGRVTLTGDAVQRDVKLELGTLEETVTVTASRSEEPSATPAAANAPAGPPSRRTVTDCSSPAGVGGNIRAPRKLRHVAPEYPAAMRTQQIEGSVSLAARIGTDGTVEDVQIVSAPHADLAGAAADAVRQWQFDETLLNCVPVPVQMKVTVNFGLRP